MPTPTDRPLPHLTLMEDDWEVTLPAELLPATVAHAALVPSGLYVELPDGRWDLFPVQDLAGLVADNPEAPSLHDRVAEVVTDRNGRAPGRGVVILDPQQPDLRVRLATPPPLRGPGAEA